MQPRRGDAAGAGQTMAAAQRRLEDAAARVKRMPMPLLENDAGSISRLLEAAQAHLRLLDGDVAGAAQWMRRWMQEYDVSENDLFPYMVRPRLLIAQHRYDEALSILERALEWVLDRHRPVEAMHISILQARAFHARGSTTQTVTGSLSA